MPSRLAYIGPEDYTEEELVERLQSESPIVVSIDVETVSLKDRTLIGIGVGLNQREAVYVSLLPDRSQYLDLVLALILHTKKLVLHNGIFDLTALIGATRKQGLNWNVPFDRLIDVLCRNLDDTSLMGQIQGIPTVQLAEMSHRYLAEDIQVIADILPKGKNMLSLTWEVVANKCLHDCLATIRLWYRMEGMEWSSPNPVAWKYEPNLGGTGWDMTESTSYIITQAMKDCYRVDIQLIPLLLKMSQRGLKLRPNRVHKWYEKMSYEILAYEDTCTRLGFNPGSNPQVGYVLASRGSFLPWTKGKKRQLKVDAETLEELDDPLAMIILEWRHRAKLLSTYLRPCLNEFRFHTNFRQDLSTMRLASYDRNAQNIPPAIREIFEPDNGIWTWADYSQIEMRIVAYASEDPIMLQAYAENKSIHSLTEMALWTTHTEETYLKSKTFNFAMLYRAQPRTLHQKTKIPLAQCISFRREWLNLYSGMDSWQQAVIEHGWEYGWSQTLFGRRCRLPPVEHGGVDHVEKCAVNYLVQGTGADIIKRAMLICEKAGIPQVLQVHDEILADGDVEFDREVLSHIHPDLVTPIEVKKGLDWS